MGRRNSSSGLGRFFVGMMFVCLFTLVPLGHRYTMYKAYEESRIKAEAERFCFEVARSGRLKASTIDTFYSNIGNTVLQQVQISVVIGELADIYNAEGDVMVMYEEILDEAYYYENSDLILRRGDIIGVRKNGITIASAGVIGGDEIVV